jgi:hypothetical protein
MQKITLNDKKYEIDFDQAIKLGLIKEEKPVEKPFTTRIGTYWQSDSDLEDRRWGSGCPASTYILAAVGPSGGRQTSVLGHVRIDDNEVKFNCFLRRMHFDEVELIATLMLNGKEIKVTHEFCRFSSHADNIREFFQKIANQIVQQVLISNSERIEKLFQSLKNELT